MRTEFGFIRAVVVAVALLFVVSPSRAALVAYWSLDEGKGEEAADKTGGGLTAAFQGKPKWVAGKVKGALEFDGTNQLTVNANPKIEPKSVTAAMWVFFNDINPPRQDFFSKNDDYALSLHEWANDGTIFPIIKTPGGWVVKAGAVKIEKEKWYHVALVYDVKSKDLMGFINAKEDSKIQAPGGIEHRGGTLTIGAYQAQRGLKGRLDEVKIWDEALTTAQLQDDMTGGSPVEPHFKATVLWGRLKREF